MIQCFLYRKPNSGFSVKCANLLFSNPRQMSIGTCQIPPGMVCEFEFGLGRFNNPKRTVIQSEERL
jgi:hypothetical protein